AIACGAVSQALMNLIMTATPLAMVGCGLTATEATLAIQWHIIGMFAPGFFTGGLINRFGIYPVMLFGLALLAACGVVALAGISVEHFFAALIAADQRPAERTKVQGVNDLIIFSVTAAASLSAGKILAGFGWSALNLTLFPFVLAAALLVLWLARAERRPARDAAE
ncbi:MAG: MFS transporter, partial [Hyphomicrobiales bacterium]|nr:MFS transporter [Hyphomicrobiales bacterium]